MVSGSTVTPACTVTYWAGRGKCEPLRCVLAAAGVCFTNHFLTQETGKAELQALRANGRLAYDQVPLVQIDGQDFVQQAPTASYLGRRFNLLPGDARDIFTAESVWASAQDARGPLVGFPFSALPLGPGELQKQQILQTLLGPRGMVGRYAVKWEEALEGRVWFLGAEPSIADVGVFEALDFFRDVYGSELFAQTFEPFPRLRAHFAAVRQLGRLAEYCDVDRQSYDTWDGKAHTKWLEYARAVRTTLD